MKKYLGLFLILFFAFSILDLGFSQEESSRETPKEIIKGKIEKIAEDGTYIIVDGKKIMTPKEFLEEAYFEVDDKVAITVKKSKDGVEAVSYEYIFEEEPESYEVGEEIPSE